MSTNVAKLFLKSCFSSFTARNQHIRSGSTFKAAILKEANKPLVIEEVKQSKLAETDVRIRVRYCSVNSVDCLAFRDVSKQMPFVPGYELSGEVIEVGQKVTNEDVVVGEKVAALSLDKFCGLSEECVVNVSDCFRIPVNVTLKEAAVLICGHSTAVYSFSKLQTPKSSDKLVISAGTAGLGLAAIDVAANMYKNKVIAVTDNEVRSELMRERGAFSTVVFGPKLRKNILELTDKKGANIIYDAVGDYMLDSIGSCAATNGRIFHASPVLYKTIPAPPPNTNLTLVSLHALRQQNLELYRCMVTDTLELADEGIITAHVSAKFKFEEVNNAIEFINTKQCTGKVVVNMDT